MVLPITIHAAQPADASALAAVALVAFVIPGGRAYPLV